MAQIELHAPPLPTRAHPEQPRQRPYKGIEQVIGNARDDRRGEAKEPVLGHAWLLPTTCGAEPVSAARFDVVAVSAGQNGRNIAHCAGRGRITVSSAS